MTAVVGILNKSGVAIAADSAVTISTDKNERKIYNSANKIFTLSKYHPVSIMIYNAASFNGVPWEILIKEYRKKIGKKKFKKLRGYQLDFIKYIKSRIDLIPEEIQKERIEYFIDFILSSFFESVVEENRAEIELESDLKRRMVLVRKLFRKKMVDYIKDLKSKDNNEGFENYTKKEFLKNNSVVLNDLIKEYFSKIKLTKPDEGRVVELVFLLIKSNKFFGRYTGLIISGFGDDEIFPSILPLKVSEVFDDRIRYIFDSQNEVSISHNTSAAIRPFAQRDVIDLILSGVDGEIQNIIYGTVDEFLVRFIDKVSSTIEPKDPKLAKAIKSIKVNEIVENFIGDIRELQNKTHINPLMSSIGTLSKEDLAELAESLIYLTYLKRRMSFSEETVGGPVDVAIITKGDGFIWLKRKNYFKSELNHSFINNYLAKV